LLRFDIKGYAAIYWRHDTQYKGLLCDTAYMTRHKWNSAQQ